MQTFSIDFFTADVQTNNVIMCTLMSPALDANEGSRRAPVRK